MTWLSHLSKVKTSINNALTKHTSVHMKRKIPEDLDEVIEIIIDNNNQTGKALLAFKKTADLKSIDLEYVYHILYRFELVGDNLNRIFYDHCQANREYFYIFLQALDMKILKNKRLQILLDPKTKPLDVMELDKFDNEIYNKTKK